MQETITNTTHQIYSLFSLNLSEQISSLTIYISTFVSLVLNGLTNLPSSQIVYLTLGYLINVNNFNFYVAIFLGALGNTIGNLILYKIIITHSDFLNSKLAKFLNINPENINRHNEYFKHRGWGWLILGKLTPSVKVLVPIICGMSRISFLKTSVIFFLGSLAWAIGVTYLGFYFGKQASLLQFYFIVTCIYIFIGSLFYFLKISNKNKK